MEEAFRASPSPDRQKEAYTSHVAVVSRSKNPAKAAEEARAVTRNEDSPGPP